MRKTELQNSLPPSLIQNSSDLLTFKGPAKPIYFPKILGEYEVTLRAGTCALKIGLCGSSVVFDYFFPSSFIGKLLYLFIYILKI